MSAAAQQGEPGKPQAVPDGTERRLDFVVSIRQQLDSDLAEGLGGVAAVAEDEGIDAALEELSHRREGDRDDRRPGQRATEARVVADDRASELHDG